MKPYLKRFLEELPRQTCFEELQVVLDHNDPDDEEVQWVVDFQNKYPGVVKHIITKPVKPIGISMNKCIESADGKYFAIWNVDDLRTPHSLKSQANVLDKNSDCDLVHGNFVITNQFGLRHGKFIDHSIHKPHSKEYTRSMVVGPFFMFRKTALYKSGLFDEQLKSGADFDLAIRLAANNSNILCAPGVLGYYLDEGKGASTNGDGRQPTERTVIELRYGIDDKVDSRWLEGAGKYNIENILLEGCWEPVEDFVPNYKQFKENNKP